MKTHYNVHDRHTTPLFLFVRHSYPTNDDDLALSKLGVYRSSESCPLRTGITVTAIVITQLPVLLVVTRCRLFSQCDLPKNYHSIILYSPIVVEPSLIVRRLKTFY